MFQKWFQDRCESDKTSDLARLCRTIALGCARDNRCTTTDSADFSQDFALQVLASSSAVEILALPSGRRFALLTRMAGRDCIDFARRIHRRQAHEGWALESVSGDETPWSLAAVDPATDPCAICERSELADTLRTAIETLRPSARQALQLSCLEQLTAVEIALRTNRTVAAVRQCLHAAKCTVRLRLISHGWTEALSREVMRPPDAPRLEKPGISADG